MSRRTDEVLFAHRSYSTLLLLFSLTHTHARTSDRPRRRRSGRLNESKRGSFEEKISYGFPKLSFPPIFFEFFMRLFSQKVYRDIDEKIYIFITCRAASIVSPRDWETEQREFCIDGATRAISE